MARCVRSLTARWWYGGGLLAALLAQPQAAPAQAPPPSADYLVSLETKDISRLWRADRLVFYGTPGTDVFPEPLGFLGANYHRFYLHYTSVRQDSAPICTGSTAKRG